MRILLAILLASSAADADTFKFDHAHGHLEKHANGCASPSATKRLLDFVGKDLQVTPGHGQMTVVADEHTSAADRVIGTVGEWIFRPDANGASITVLVNVDALGWCTEARTCATHAPAIRVAIIQRYAGSECYEAWRGDGVKL